MDLLKGFDEVMGNKIGSKLFLGVFMAMTGAISIGMAVTNWVLFSVGGMNGAILKASSLQIPVWMASQTYALFSIITGMLVGLIFIIGGGRIFLKTIMGYK